MAKKKRNDLLLIGCLLALGILSFLSVEWYKTSTTKNAQVVVFVDGTETGRYLLAQDEEILIKGTKGDNLLVIKNGKAWVEEAECPDKLCVHTGKISRNGETIVCLPNKIVVEVVNGEKNEIDISTN